MIRRRRADSYGTEQDSALRKALTAAAESVEPAEDGLDKIRSKIMAGQAAQRVRWRFGMPAVGEPWWRSLLPPRGWLPAVGAAVMDRFRPDPNRAGWFGWLRPAAAVGTGLFVATAASWAVAALPAAISPSSTTGGPVATPGATKTHHPSKPGTPGFTSSGSGSVGPSGQNGGSGGGPGPTTTPSCSPPASPSATPTGTPSNGTPSGSPTSTDTSTPSDTPTDPGSTTPAAVGSSTSSPTPGSAPTPGSEPTPGNEAMAPVSAVSPEATGKTLLSGNGAASRWPRTEAVRATIVDDPTASPPPDPGDTPLPTASPTVGGPVPTQTPEPTVPPVPCP